MTDAFKSVEHTLTYIRKAAPEYANAKASRVYLEEFRKSKKALLMVQAEQQGIKTIGAQEVFAYSHAEYLDVLQGLRVAVEEEERLRLLIKGAELRLEVWRSEQANQRAERSAYGA